MEPMDRTDRTARADRTIRGNRAAVTPVVVTAATGRLP